MTPASLVLAGVLEIDDSRMSERAFVEWESGDVAESFSLSRFVDFVYVEAV
jgi:hypothetical protein